MNRKSRILIVLLILAILATFTACGGAAEPGTKDGASAPTKKPTIFSPAEPEKVSVTGIELSDAELTAYLGTDSVKGTLTASVQPEDAEQKGVKFASSDPSVVKVDETGNFQALSIGTAVITVTAEDPDFTGSASCTIMVKSQVESIVLSAAEEIMYADDTASLTAQVKPANVSGLSFAWASSDASVATVDDNGNVTALKPGHAVVTYTVQDGSGIQGACDILVGVPIKSLKINEKAVTVLVGVGGDVARKQLTITTVPEESAVFGLKWSSSNEAVATVDDKGVVTGVSAGKATITGVSKDPKSNGKIKAVCVVTVGDAVKSIDLTGAGDRLQKAKVMKLAAALTPAKPFNAKLNWSSSDESVLTVDAKGTVKAVGVGSATVTCTAADGSNTSAQYKITVYQPVTKLTPSTKKLVILEKTSGTISVTALPEDATDKSVEWSSSDPSVAKVDQKGNVTAGKKGSAVITATAKDGSKKVTKITVYVEPRVPLSAETFTRSGYFGFYTTFAVTFKNVTQTRKITHITFKVTYESNGSTKSYLCSDDCVITGGHSRRLGWWNGSGLIYARNFKVYLRSVRYADGTSQSFSDELIGWFW